MDTSLMAAGAAGDDAPLASRRKLSGEDWNF